MSEETRAINTVDDPNIVGSDALADLEVELYNRLTETSAAGALGIKFTETDNSLPYPVVTVNNQGEVPLLLRVLPSERAVTLRSIAFT